MAEAAEPGGDEVRARLEARLDRASEAAERLLADAAARVVRRPPPAGWQHRSGDGAGGGGSPPPPLGPEIDLLLGVLTSWRDRVPPDLQHRLTEAIREVLLALRALIDWYLERTDGGQNEPPEVEDIPIL